MSDSIQVVHGNPDETELAIVVSLVAAASAAAPVVSTDEAAATSNWARPAMRTTPPSGPGAWWRSGLPRP